MRGWSVLLVAAIVGVVGLGAYAGWNLRDLPQRDDAAAIVRGVDILDRNGQVLAQRSANGEFHIFTRLSDMGEYAKRATLAAEDRDFYRHGPVDTPALIRAAVTDVVRNEPVQGASTITQQLVKIEVVGSERTVSRKLQETFLAWAMERRYDKDQILEMYLNRVYYGYGAYGLASAAKAYFGRDMQPKDLSLAQAAFLAGLLQAPSALDPKTNFNAARARQLYVLKGMVQMGAVKPEQQQQAEQEDIRSQLRFDLSYRRSKAPHFVDYVMSRVEKDVGAAVVQQGGLKISTTLDANLQSLAEQSVSSGVGDLRRYGVNNGDLLAVRPATGEVLAWVGSADYTGDSIGGQFNVVLSARQPGSSFKPYVYAAALRDRRITLCTTLDDKPTDFNGYRPVNFDNRFLGSISARRALLLSRNVPALQVGQMEGMANVDRLATDMGIRSNLDTNLATAIGASEVTMFDHVQAYAVFANLGKKVPLTAVTRVRNAKDEVIFVQQPGQQEGQAKVMSPAEAYLITDVLKDYSSYWRLGWRPRMAGKSGTTGGSRYGVHGDAWMMAYNPDIVVGAWAGNTGPDGSGQPVRAFGVNVGSTISARFINGLPSAYQHWYRAPLAGLVSRHGELFLAGTQNRPCDEGGDEGGDEGD